MLIDRKHWGWGVATSAAAVAAVGLYLYCYHTTPGGLTGGDLVGLGYGLAGSALMLVAGALSLVRRVPSWRTLLHRLPLGRRLTAGAGAPGQATAWGKLAGLPRWALARLWAGPRKVWLRAHIWLGLLSGVLILCHSGGRLGGPLEQVLMAVVGLTLLTGVVGLALQQVLPRLVTLRAPSEAPYEQLPHLCDAMRQHADAVIDRAVAGAGDGRDNLKDLTEFYFKQVRPFLGAAYDRSSPLAHPLQSEALFDLFRRLPGLKGLEVKLTVGGQPTGLVVLDRLQACCEERRQLGEQERLHRLLHGWLLLHVPLSVALLVLGVAHAVLALYY